MDSTTSLRERFAARLAERGIDRHQAAKEIGRNQDTLQKWFKGKESPSIDRLVAAWLDRPIMQITSAPPAPAAPAGADDQTSQQQSEAMDRLNEQNRILQGCAMLPRGKKLTDKEIETV